MASTPDEPNRVSFAITWRGYDREQVDAFVDEIARRIQEHDDFQRAGTEVASALRALHGSVLDIRSEAEQEARRLIAEAEEQARRERADADDYARAMRVDAEEQAQQIRREGEAQVAALRSDAEVQAWRVRGEADQARAEADERLTEAEALLAEANRAMEAKRSEADQYLTLVLAAAGADARAHALAAVQDLRDDLARLVSERDLVRTQLRQLRDAIAETIGQAATRSVDLTDEQGGSAGKGAAVSPGAEGPAAGPEDLEDEPEDLAGGPDHLVDDIVAKAVRSAISPRVATPPAVGGP